MKIPGLVLAFFLFNALPLASAQINSFRGTIVIVGAWKHKVFIAADSKGQYMDGSDVYDDCKISAFGGKYIFAAAGTRSGILRSGMWDSHVLNFCQTMYSRQTTSGYLPPRLVFGPRRRVLLNSESWRS